MTDRIEIAGVPVSALNMDLACAAVRSKIGGAKGAYFIFRDMNGIVRANQDRVLRQAHLDAAFVAPDGMPLVWIARWLGFGHVSRVYGPDFMLDFCARTEAAGYRHYFYGSTEDVVGKLVHEIGRRFPGLEDLRLAFAGLPRGR